MITLGHLSHSEAMRYMGGAGIEPDERMSAMLSECEALVLQTARPKFLYRIAELPDEELAAGNDIKAHLSGCDKAAVLCATLGADVDKLIRVTQVSDMARAVMLNSFANVAVEQLCDKAEQEIAAQYPDRYMTFRYSPGYGDYPLSLQKTLLTFLDAPRKIGLSANENHLLIPSKSVTAVAGLSLYPIEQKRQGCAVCQLRGDCSYRRNGGHCGF